MAGDCIRLPLVLRTGRSIVLLKVLQQLLGDAFGFPPLGIPPFAFREVFDPLGFVPSRVTFDTSFVVSVAPAKFVRLKSA